MRRDELFCALIAAFLSFSLMHRRRSLIPGLTGLFMASGAADLQASTPKLVPLIAVLVPGHTFELFFLSFCAIESHL